MAKRSKQNLRHHRLQAMELGKLEPIDCYEVLPGDSMRHSVSALIRVAPLVVPVMHEVEVRIWSFFVPNRLVWDGWEDFIVSPDSGLSVPQVPIIDSSSPTQAYGLARFLGFGSARGTADAFPVSRSVSALSLRAYARIFNEFFRDQDIDTPMVESVGNGPDTASWYATRHARWKKDYFTLARTSPQRGSTGAVEMGIYFQETGATPGTRTLDRGAATADANLRVNETGTAGAPITAGAQFSIESWRQAMATQKVREHRNKFGSRYHDYLAFLGVRSSDARLQRPEFLGGGATTISFSEVLATAESAAGPLGEMAGHGIATIRTRPYRRFFEEHGHVITVMAVRPKGMYANAVPRRFYRASWADFWQKETEMLGDQPVLKKELNAAEAVGTANDVFGYVSRHEDYRHELSTVVGEFAGILDDWHFARMWDSNTGPALNSTFLACEPALRPFADQENEEVLRVMINHDLVARRLVSGYSRN